MDTAVSPSPQRPVRATRPRVVKLRVREAAYALLAAKAHEVGIPLTVLPAPRGKVGLRVSAADYVALEAIAKQADIPLVQPGRAEMVKLRVSAEEYAALEA